MNDHSLAEPPLTTASERLAVALALIREHDYLGSPVTSAQLGAWALRMQLVLAALAPMADTLAGLTRRSISATSEVTHGTAGLVAAETARNHLISTHDKLRQAHQDLVRACHHLRVATAGGQDPELPPRTTHDATDDDPMAMSAEGL